MTIPEDVAVYGGGRMGAGIAHAFVLAGARVTIIESSSIAAAQALDRVRMSIEKAVDRGATSGPLDGYLAAVSVTSDPALLAGHGLVIEAVPEDVVLKQKVFETIESVVPDAWLATNTSSLSVDQVATVLRRPERLIGLHFFNPVPASALVEIVTGAATAPELVELARNWVAGIEKTAIVVNDSPGFASSRLGVALALEAMRMLEEGVASAEDIDTALTLGYKHPVGPLRTTDIVGLDVRLAIAEHLAAEVGDRFDPPEILRAKVAAGDLGRKSGHGFFAW